MRYSAVLVNIFLTLVISGTAMAQSGSHQVGCSDVTELVKQVSVLRGLAVKTPVRCIEMERDEYIAYKQKSYVEEVTPDRLLAEEIAFKLIGLIDPTFSYRECLAESYSQSLIASYDTQRQAILLPKGESVDKSVLAHELVHALQDQHFGLAALQAVANRSSDSALALAALVEGDALLLEQMMPREHRRAIQGIPVTSSPRCASQVGLEAQFDFPYSFGAVYANRLTSPLGFTALDRAFLDPIRCTSHVLHKDTSSACPNWQSLLISTPERTWIEDHVVGEAKEVFVDSLGEYTLGLILSSQLGRTRAILAAKGWAGDKLTLWRGAQGDVVSLVTEWKSLNDALEFSHLFGLSAAQRYSISLEPNSRNWQFSTKENTVRLSQSGVRVVLFFVAHSIGRVSP